MSNNISAPIINNSAPIVKKLSSAREELLIAFSNNYFYLELLLVCVTILLSVLLAYAIRFRVNIYLKNNQPLRIDKEFITKPVSLLSPIFAYILLNIVKPIAVEYSKNSAITDAVINICVFYFFARVVLLVVYSRLVAWFIAFVIMSVAVLDVTGFMTLTTTYFSTISFHLGDFKISLLNLINGLIILVVVLWGAGLLSHTLESYLRRASSLSYNARELSVKFFRVFIYFIALMIALSVFGVDLTAFAVFSGALGVGIGLGLQRITANFLSGITLLIEKSIKLGDLIEVGDVSGLVRQLNIRYALIEGFDGKEILIPNEELISTRVINWTYSNCKARVDINVGVSYNCNARLAQELILESAKEHPDCISDPAPNCFLREFADSSINFMLVFWVRDVKNGRLDPQSEVMFKILDKFK
ncbi:MAG: mechanosensitive ion channel domain-containing protein, partial [Rickettsiales bacterium]